MGLSPGSATAWELKLHGRAEVLVLLPLVTHQLQCSLRSKRFRLVLEQRKILGFGCAINETRAKKMKVGGGEGKEKNSGETVRRLGTIIQSIFCAQSGASIDRLQIWRRSHQSEAFR